MPTYPESRVFSRTARRRTGVVARFLAAAVLIAVIALTAAGCIRGPIVTGGPTETRDDTFTVGESPRVVVNSENGRVEVTDGFDGEVGVQATLRIPERIDYQVDQEGDTITVDVRIDRAGLVGQSPSVDISVTAPVETDVDIETSNGAIDVRGLEGNGYMRTSNGRITLEDVRGEFEGRTSNGRIGIDALEGSADLRTSNGEVYARDVKGEFALETSNGRISFSGELTAGGSNRLVTSNGSADVELLGVPSVRLDVSARGGEITSSLPITTTKLEDDHIVGTIGDGEADLYVDTSNGDVTIR